MGRSKSKVPKQTKRDKEIVKKQHEDMKEDSKNVKILLLGAGESGKSTFLKQMQLISGLDFPEDVLVSYKPKIIINLIEGCVDLINGMQALGLDFTASESTAQAELVISSAKMTELTQEIADAIVGLWDNDSGVKQAFKQRSKFQLQDNYDYLVDSVRGFPEWGGPKWTPNVNDIIRARVRTTGIVQEELQIKGVGFQFLDVGGQRNERRKWIHSFENVNAVIHVVAMQEYDQVLFEDADMNRLIEARELFQKMAVSEWFDNTPLILFLNKSDLFREKLCNQKIPLNVSGLFPDAPKSFEFEDGVEWIKKFILDGMPASKRKVYVYETCATDTDAIKNVFQAASDIILRGNLAQAGLSGEPSAQPPPVSPSPAEPERQQAGASSPVFQKQASKPKPKLRAKKKAVRKQSLKLESESDDLEEESFETPPKFVVEHVTKLALGSGAFAPSPEKSLAYFSAFAPKAIQPGASFLLNVWAFCKSQRAEVIKIEAKAGKTEAGTKGPLCIFIGDKIVIELELPKDAFEIEAANGSDSMEWFGEATNTTFAVTCKRDAPIGQFACKASIFVINSDDGVKEKRGVLIFQLNVKKKWGLASVFGFGGGSKSNKSNTTVRSLPSSDGAKSDGELSATLTILPRKCSPHIFISYRRMHKDLGQLIRVGLERYGYDCFLDINPTTGLGPGDFQAQLKKAMITAKVVIPLLTPAPSGPPGTKRFKMTSMECLKDAIACGETDFCQYELEWALSDPDKIVLPLYRDIATSDIGKELSGLPESLSRMSTLAAFAFHDDMVDSCILRTHNQIQSALVLLEKKNVDAANDKPVVRVDSKKLREREEKEHYEQDQAEVSI